ncbi:MAG: UvrABC system protein B [Parcubacteria group bacterium ADurb.Bin326]|nr:MAG: UvrABC system protein B [Parcubacteria group bacterium ADurb.Bin326]
MGKKLFNLKSKYKPSGDQPEAIKKLVAGLQRGDDFQTLLGITGSGKTFTMANVIEQYNKPVLVMAPNKSLAAQLYREYKNFFPDNSVNYFVSYYDYYQPEAYLPNSDTYIEKEAMINDEIDRLRHQATTALLSRKDVIIVASVSCIYGLGLPINYLEAAIHLTVGQAIVRADLIKQLIKIQFVRTTGELKRGTFRVRGGVFEIMPASETAVYRIEFDEQVISAISLVDQLTRKIKEEMTEIVIFPPKHFISEQPEIDQALKNIKAELKDRLAYFRKKKLYLEAERLERRVRYDLEMLKTIGYCHGIENYSRHLSGKLPGEAPENLLSYFPKDKNGKPDYLLIMDESHIGVPQVRGMYEGDRSRKETLAQYGWRLPSALDNRPLKFEEFLERINQTIFTSATPGDFEIKHSKQLVEQVIRPTGLVDPPIEVRPVFDRKTNRSQIDDVIEETKKITDKGERSIINTLTKKQAEDLNNFFAQHGIKSNYLHSDVKTIARNEILLDFRRGKFDVLIGVNLLREGLDLPEVTFVAILDADREGFLRSETSLIQIMGRAARNVSGKVILYADNLTGSIKRAVGEVERRRAKQLEYNKKNKIRPETIRKKIEDFLDIPEKEDEE